MPLQTGFTARLPDFRNLGVCLRILLIVNLMALIAAVLQTNSLTDTAAQLTEWSAFLQPVLMLSLLLLYAASTVIGRFPYWAGVATVFFVELALTTIVHLVASDLFASDFVFPLTRALLIT
ncbi:MAG TPA: sensor histidine kinase, partial [Methylophilaceae bacterium]|nr:sensor histidine kinase [Methylophilaceae bacterium]